MGLEVEFEFALEAFGFSGAMLRSPLGYRVELLHRVGNVAGIEVARPMDAALTRGFGHLALDVDDLEATHRPLARRWGDGADAAQPVARARSPDLVRQRPRGQPHRAAGPSRGSLMTGRLDGKIALITGVGGGMGVTAASMFAAEGARVVGCDLDVAGAARTEELVRHGGRRDHGDGWRRPR